MAHTEGVNEHVKKAAVTKFFFFLLKKKKLYIKKMAKYFTTSQAINANMHLHVKI